MSTLEKDSRFSRVLTDPRFLPMPTYEKKVKIDKRFNALFTSKDFGHRTLLDKRGRPIHDVSKRGKHVMEQFYQVSSEDSSSSDDDDSDDSSSEEYDETEEPENAIVSHDDSDADTGSTSTKKKKSKDESAQSISKQKVNAEKKKTSLSNKKRTHEDEEEDEDEDGIEQKPAAKRLKKGKLSGHLDEEDNTSGMAKRKSKISKRITEVDDDDDEEDMDEDEEEYSDSDSDDSSDEEDDYTEGHELQETQIDHKWDELHRDAPVVTDSTHRLAVCNMDWDFVKAQDLFVLFNSFAGEGGSVQSVIIYPSEFGKERMAEEAVLGPKEMRDNLNSKTKDNSKEKKKRKKEKPVDGETQKRMEKEVVKNQTEVLRNYQLNRLRYYYAVVDCSSVEVADNIYKECDGQEYQLSCVKLDLRFIPDDMTFGDSPKESFTEEQGLVEYTPKTFNSSALSKATVEVTWDETDFDRLQKKMLYTQPKELEDIVEENRFADIIAPPESDSENDGDGRPQWLRSVLAQGDSDDEECEEDISEEKKISLYRKVLMDKLVEEEEKEKRENEVHKEMQWTPGLKSAVRNKLKKNEKVEGTLVDEFLQKKKEKKKKKRELRKAELAKADDDDDDDDDDDNDDEEAEDNDVPDIIDDSLKEMMESEGMDVDSIKAKKKKKVNKKKKNEMEDDSEAEREKAELELLLMGDVGDKSIAKPEKVKSKGKLSRHQKKKQALKERDRKRKEREELTVDVDDQRFSAMFTSHHFHIDPNAPEFKKTENMMKLVDEQIKRKPKMKKGKSLSKAVNGNAEEDVDSRAVSKKLLESLKRKMKK